MKSSVFTSFFAAVGVSLVSAVPFKNAISAPAPRQAGCEHSATARGCWGEYSIDTDYYTVIPDTGVTRGKSIFGVLKLVLMTLRILALSRELNFGT